MRQNPVRTVLRQGRMAHGIMATEFLTPGLCQILGNAGVDYVIFDMEHGGMALTRSRRNARLPAMPAWCPWYASRAIIII